MSYHSQEAHVRIRCLNKHQVLLQTSSSWCSILFDRCFGSRIKNRAFESISLCHQPKKVGIITNKNGVVGPCGLDCRLENQEITITSSLKNGASCKSQLACKKIDEPLFVFLKEGWACRVKQHRLCAGSGCSLVSVFLGRWTTVIAMKHNSSFPIRSLYILNVYSASVNNVVRQAIWTDYAINQSTPVKAILCIYRTCCLTAFRLNLNCIG